MSMVFLGVWGLLWAIWKRPMKSQEITRKPTTNSANIWHISANPRKTGNGQVQIFQVWRWPHLVMSRCNMAKENWNSWNHWKAETLESFQENESPMRALRSSTDFEFVCSQQFWPACEIDSWQSTDSLISRLVQFSSNIQGISKVGSIIHKIQV